MAAFSVVTNIASSTAQSNMMSTSVGLQKALNRLSSGLRINYSGDDAAGLAVANGYRADVAIVNQGIRNANDGLSTLQISDGALGNISTLLDRLATLSTQAASGGLDATVVGNLDTEFQAVVSEIDREAGSVSSGAFSVFLGDSTITDTIATTDAAALGLDSLSLGTDAAGALDAVKAAVTTLGTAQSKIGSLENNLQYAIGLAQSQVVNTQAAESRIRDANIAEESANMTRYNILTQSGVAALAQANQSSSAILTLLR